jgi:uncharacterized membrane protein
MVDESLKRQSESIRQNIDAVVKLEQDSLRDRSFADRLADSIAAFAGSFKFVLLHILFYGSWIVINLGLVPDIPRFDPYPFMLLSMSVSLEAIFLSTFVLIKQNRMSRREDLRAHLDLQINLLSEREMTLVLQLLREISGRLGVHDAPPEFHDLSEKTSVEALANEIMQKLPEE